MSELEEVDPLGDGGHGEHFRKNCVGRNRGVELWRLNQRVILVIATGEGFVFEEEREGDEKPANCFG